MILITAPKINAVPTAIGAGTPSSRINTGAVTAPDPTPVSPTASAITKPSVTSSMLFAGLDMNPAFELLSTPAARTQIVRILGLGRARRAADARIALIVQRQERQSLALHIGPD